MRSIELQTTQNVTINYDLALLRDRILAFILDSVIVGITVLLIANVLFGLVLDLGLSVEFQYLVLAPVFTFYTLVMESLNQGQTIGKMALRIKVVRIDGEQMVFTDYLLRWVFRMVDIWMSMGAIAIVVISSSSKGQRLGDLVSNTTVVKANPSLFVSLRDIQQIKTTSNYTPQYPDVRHFREQDMLTIKQTLDRYLKFHNKAHSEALSQLTESVCEKLQITVVPDKKVEFLRGLIKDYIVLTR